MNAPDEPSPQRRLGILIIALAGIALGGFVAVFMFLRLRAAWNDGIVDLGPVAPDGWDLSYEDEPLRYIVAMSALYPAAIAAGAILAAVSAFLLSRHWPAVRERLGRRSR